MSDDMMRPQTWRQPADPHIFHAVLAERFHGILSCGRHAAGEKACVMEAARAACGLPWGDDAEEYWPDLRALNDASWLTPFDRTDVLTAIILAAWDWRDWPLSRRAVATRRLIESLATYWIPLIPTLTGPSIDRLLSCDEAVEIAAQMRIRPCIHERPLLVVRDEDTALGLSLWRLTLCAMQQPLTYQQIQLIWQLAGNTVGSLTTWRSLVPEFAPMNTYLWGAAWLYIVALTSGVDPSPLPSQAEAS